mgnify:FL=1|tara:strand:+ start:449 stop:727 length:279 start_codon:yes stop_codon:yes gene_type:complete
MKKTTKIKQTDHRKVYQKTWVLRSTYDDHWFDDVKGDCFEVAYDWREFDTEDEILKYLQRDIYEEGGSKPANFKTIKEYVEAWDFQVFKRVH